MTTDKKIISKTQSLFAHRGYDGVSMRVLADKLNISPSVIYHYFKDKDVLLRTMYEQTNRELGIQRAKLILSENVEQNLRQLLLFQFEHMQEIVAVLKYYLHFRNQFLKQLDGRLPQKAALHVEEILEHAIKGSYFKEEVMSEVKMITHVINGFILEIYPSKMPKEEVDALVNQLSQFILRSLSIYIQ